ncbi:archaellin/type IV pilin N-terminal domain-containing protein [Halobacterium litoreum]|uniref:Archaellin/type IV pilin N-terminal domain-containing protein n=1 Tax=Halobacterium litoreum TaxID=2039234 RepID=A0ABD5NEK8_9EURY|nr:archaellin/type IV pilin N-terminal domain-containing protein [Halobacterium litoreum]UHH13491.1 type IV pilin [Halobacterium litoreum]
MPPLHEDERATSPVVGAVLLLVVTVLVGAAVGAGVFLNKDTVNADVEIAVTGEEATVLWTEEGSATHLVVSTGNSLSNATIDSVNGTVRVPGDVGQASANTKIIVRAVNNETRRIIEERTVDLSDR